MSSMEIGRTGGIIELASSRRHRERSDAIQRRKLDCFVAPLLAMTAREVQE
jgi:hypothetical protein